MDTAIQYVEFSTVQDEFCESIAIFKQCGVAAIAEDNERLGIDEEEWRGLRRCMQHV